MRLNRFLAAAGVGSRRHCDELIAAGRITINGQICTNFSAQPSARDHVKVDGKLVHVEPLLTILLHKPAGFVSTRKDVHARDAIFDLLPKKFSRLFNIGRLDAQSEGLILLTNDGDLAQRLTHPRYKIEKDTRLRVILRQGINRQIRNMFHEIGYEVKRLVRVRIGNLRLGDLPRGHWRPLTKREIESVEVEATTSAANREPLRVARPATTATKK